MTSRRRRLAQDRKRPSLGRPRSLNRRGDKPQTYRGRKLTPNGLPRPRNSKASWKAELMEQARRAGWRGKTYAKAKRFERRLERGR